MEFSLSATPLQPAQLADGLTAAGSGACVTFSGTVRNTNAGRDVIALEYEAYEPLCLKEMARIFQEAQEKFPVTAVRVVHRTGRLEIGDAAVWIGVTAPHRAEAFDCCRYLIDELKARLPIWKKEFYRDGDSGWIGIPDSSPRTENNGPVDAAGELERDVAYLTPQQLAAAVWIDVREPYERMLAPLKGVNCLELPFGDFRFDPQDFHGDKEYLVFCSRGIRSLEAVLVLRRAGILNTYSLNNTFGEIKDAVTSRITS